MHPFKLKPELAASSLLMFKVAEEVFGNPSWYSFSESCNYASWERDFQYETLRLSIQHFQGDSKFKVDYSIGWKYGVCAPRHPLQPAGEVSSWWLEMWNDFMLKAGRPWSEWTEDEIMSSSMWCRYFVESGNVPSGTIHTMMVLKSFEDPDDPHIKGYFKACQKIPTT